jgi:dihydroxy-acid dehydratase
VASRRLSLDIPERELAARRARWQPPPARFERGYGSLYTEHVTQADQGCDFGFLARRGAYPEPNPQ